MSTKLCPSLNREVVAAFLLTLESGDIGILPAGTATWNSEVTWNPPANVTLQGSGSLSTRGGGDATIIIDGIDRTGFDQSLFTIVPPTTGYFRLSRITFQGNGVASSFSSNGRIRFFGPGRTDPCFVIDYCHFDRMNYTAVLEAGIYGVFKECKFTSCASRQFGFGNGDVPWNEATDLGTDKFVFHEDCDFLANPLDPAVNDAYFGGRFVFRYCNMRNTGPQTHPTGGSGRARGSRAYEVYRNNISSTGNNFNFAFLSSGTGVFHHNDFSGGSNYTHMLTLHAMRRNNTTYTQIATPNGWGYAGTAFNGTGSNWDKNDDVATGYPNLDMLGSGPGDLLSGEFPNTVNVTRGNIGSTDPNCHAHQSRDPFYEWENNWVNPGMGGAKVTVYESDTILLDRDYFSDVAKPGYTEYTYPHPFAVAVMQGDSNSNGGGGGGNGGGGTDPIPPVIIINASTEGTVKMQFTLPKEIIDYLRKALNDKES